MYAVRIRYTASVFLNAVNVHPNTRNLAGLLSELEAYQVEPVVGQEIVNGQPMGRLGFRTSDKKKDSWMLMLGASRFDLVMGTSDQPHPFEDFCTLSGEVFQIVLSFLSRKVHRLAAVQHGVLSDLELAKKLPGRFFTVPKGMQAGSLLEYSWKYGTQSDASLGEHEKVSVNSLVTLAHSEGRVHVPDPMSNLVAVELNGVLMQTDVNTAATSQDERFSGDDVGDFFHQASGWHDSLVADVLGAIEEATQ